MRTETKARLDLTGMTPLVVNNARLADPTDSIAVQIKHITDKGVRMTAEEREQKEALQWAGSLYLSDDDQVVFPGRNFIRAFRDVAPAFKLGANIDRGGVMILEPEIAVQHDGPQSRKALWENPRYRFRTVVNGNPTRGPKGGKVTSMRPIFPVWSMSLTAVVFADILGWDDFLRIVDAAGAQGIGNARKLGYGRFTAKVTQL
jgi:hypothetical protein